MKNNPISIKVINDSPYNPPKHETEFSAGLDLRANVTETIVLKPFERVVIPTGLKIELPVGYVALVCPRSGLAINKGITVLNAPGVVDSDFRGDVGVILINLSTEPFEISPGDRVAQMVIVPHVQAEMLAVLCLSDTERAEGGFGHTGTK